jgi:hypothetical protein
MAVCSCTARPSEYANDACSGDGLLLRVAPGVCDVGGDREDMEEVEELTESGDSDGGGEGERSAAQKGRFGAGVWVTHDCVRLDAVMRGQGGSRVWFRERSSRRGRRPGDGC